MQSGLLNMLTSVLGSMVLAVKWISAGRINLHIFWSLSLLDIDTLKSAIKSGQMHRGKSRSGCLIMLTVSRLHTLSG